MCINIEPNINIIFMQMLLLSSAITMAHNGFVVNENVTTEGLRREGTC